MSASGLSRDALSKIGADALHRLGPADRARDGHGEDGDAEATQVTPVAS